MNKVQEILATPKVHAGLATAFAIGQAFVPVQYQALAQTLMATFGFNAAVLPHQDPFARAAPSRPRAPRKPRAPQIKKGR